jgi:TolB-like protein/Tfp pilus assembly protein PilF
MQERRLAAIMFTDIVGYTSLMGEDENKAFQILRKNRNIHRPLIKKYRGKWLKEIGDGILASFYSSSDAVLCASEIQMVSKREGIPLRIGIHEGEVVFESGDVLGDGVNVASRLQELAQEGCINISGAVYRDIKNKPGINAEFIEEKSLKNVDEPIKVYKVKCEGVISEDVVNTILGQSVKWRKYLPYYFITGLVIMIGVFMIWYNLPEKPVEELDKSIAVLPLDYLSEDQDKEYLADGVMDAITSHLAKIDDLRVMARTSVEKYRNNPTDPREIGNELKVSYLLEGSFQMHGENVRLITQLINTSDGSHKWSNEYDRKYTDIFKVQSEVAQAIAKEVAVAITPEVKERIETIPTENLEAYNLYLQGRYFWNQGGRNDLDKSIQCYKRALEIDPKYALAFAGMATTYFAYAWYGYLPRRDAISQARTAAMKALELDNSVGEAHAELANIRLIYDWNWSESEKGFKRALELNPSSARAHNRYAWLLSVVGRHDEAIEHSKIANELDPLSVEIWVEFGRRYYFAHDYDRAIEEYRKVLELFPTIKYSRISWYAYSELALALSEKGLHNEAIEEFLKTDFDAPADYWRLGYIYGVAGKQAKALEILDYYFELSKKSDFKWTANIACIYIGLGEKDKAFEWLEKSYEQRDSWLIQIKVDPMYNSLRSDPRFQDLLERMNFPD